MECGLGLASIRVDGSARNIALQGMCQHLPSAWKAGRSSGQRPLWNRKQTGNPAIAWRHGGGRTRQL